MARCAIATALALALAVVAGGLFLSAAASPPSSADTAGTVCDEGLQRYTIATNHAVAQAFPQIEQIGGFRPDPLNGHAFGLALDILIPGDPASPVRVAVGDDIRDFLLTHAEQLGVDHLIWRQHIYHADGTWQAMQDRGSPSTNNVDHLHVVTKGGGYP